MNDRLRTYRQKRDARLTSEPIPSESTSSEPTPRKAAPKGDDTFVIQLHQARRLHWDFRLERSGVLVSWAIPKCPPLDPKTNHLAVHTEDHPIEYAQFTGSIPQGQYGGGVVTLWDRGSYETEKWTDREVKVVLHGSRLSGRYVLFQTSGDDWMIHRMDAAPPPPDEPLPRFVAPMRATPGAIPAQIREFGYELHWDGLRVSVYVANGGATIRDGRGRDRTADFPGVAALGQVLTRREAVLDGEIIALDADGHPAPRLLRRRTEAPIIFMAFDLLHLDGESLLSRPYGERRRRLQDLKLAADAWQTPPYFTEDPEAVLAASQDQGFPGIVAKRIDSAYEPGNRSTEWIAIGDDD